MTGLGVKVHETSEVEGMTLGTVYGTSEVEGMTLGAGNMRNGVGNGVAPFKNRKPLAWYGT